MPCVAGLQGSKTGVLFPFLTPLGGVLFGKNVGTCVGSSGVIF